ncbi:MAG TPA: F0F1 ATP synthase subunit A [Candidatus Dormibacteraeota bacterium]
MILTETPPVNHPTFDLGCGSFCQVNYDSVISSAIAIVVTIVVAILIARSLQPGRPGRPQALAEWVFSYVRRTAFENAPDAPYVVPLAATLGFYILVANYLDFFPITLLPNVHPANTDINQTAAMALVVFIVVNAYTIRIRGVRGFLHHLTRPFDLPIWARAFFTILNIIEEIVKPVTLAFRLFGNLLAGLLMVFVITLLLGNLPYVGSWFVGPAAVAIWKLFDVLFIGLIQAFIFMLLTIVYFGLAREGLDEKHTAH